MNPKIRFHHRAMLKFGELTREEQDAAEDLLNKAAVDPTGPTTRVRELAVDENGRTLVGRATGLLRVLFLHHSDGSILVLDIADRRTIAQFGQWPGST